MTDFSLLVTGSPFSTAAHQSALRFIRSVYALNHQVVSVFFYGEGSLVANRYCDSIHQQKSLSQQWQEISHELNIPLMACVTTVTRRGMIDQEEQNQTRFDKQTDQQKLPHPNVSDKFSLVGLGALVDMITRDQKIIEFIG
ncbi:MAG: sulfurtransferase complex subunit TusD [Gammaproteobacteria bacterium CG22_combo_CG10-13_8_21_14_all_40_8]|nr:MAG: sulfurtransferase complex subunit TusD [Gammaproteobacteria bacterium CG22_combo_CG10-13_8_21_14_all_40_8]